MYEPTWTVPTRKKNQVAYLITFNKEKMDICLQINGKSSIVCEENKFH